MFIMLKKNSVQNRKIYITKNRSKNLFKISQKLEKIIHDKFMNLVNIQLENFSKIYSKQIEKSVQK